MSSVKGKTGLTTMFDDFGMGNGDDGCGSMGNGDLGRLSGLDDDDKEVGKEKSPGVPRTILPGASAEDAVSVE